MKEFLQFFSVMVIFALVAGLSKPVQAADTSDVIAGIIFGGIVGSHIEKDKHRNQHIDPHITTLPYGTIIVPGYRMRGTMQCLWEVDSNGFPNYAIPTCKTYGNSYYNRHTNSYILQLDRQPCGAYWGMGCRKLVEQLKTGQTQGVFDFR